MKKKLLVILLSLWIGSSVSAQNLIFDIFVNNRSIGEIKAECTNDSGIFKYFLESEVSYNFLFNFDYSYTIKTTFDNNVMTEAFALNRINNKIRASSVTKLEGSDYYIELIDDKKVLNNHPITYSMISLYFKEPLSITKVYSERYGVFLDIEPTGNHKYRLTLPNGRKIIFNYKEGKCIEVKVDHAITTVYFRLRDQKQIMSAY